MRRSPRARRATFTTSCDETPAGLSTSINPSALVGVVFCCVARGIGGRRVLGSVLLGPLLLDLGEERLDARRTRHGLIELEGDLRRELEAERLPHAAAEVRRDALEPVVGR